VVLSAILAHMGWHWMEDGGHELAHQLGHVGLSSASVIVAPWLLLALGVGALARLLPARFDAEAIPSLLPALLGQRARESSSGPTVD
jgi:hypothetical protein